LGLKERAFAPLVAVSLEALVPQDHFYRYLDRTFDLSFVRNLVRDTYTPLGRPSIDPVVFFRLQLVMFFEGIRSERLLMRLVADKLSVRWYVGYDLNEPLPDHSSLTRIRTRYGLDMFQRFFEAIVEQCCQANLVWGKELYVDATQVNTNAAYTSLTPRFAVEARSALQEHLAALFPQDGAQDQLNTPKEVASCEVVMPTSLLVAISEELRQELTARNEAHHDWIAKEGPQQREVTGRNYQRIADFRVSTTDQGVTPMRLKGGAFTWATIPTLSLMAASGTSLCRYW
jgi:transposase